MKDIKWYISDPGESFERNRINVSSTLPTNGIFVGMLIHEGKVYRIDDNGHAGEGKDCCLFKD